MKISERLRVAGEFGYLSPERASTLYGSSHSQLLKSAKECRDALQSMSDVADYSAKKTEKKDAENHFVEAAKVLKEAQSIFRKFLLTINKL